MRSRNQKSRRIPAAFAAFRGQRSEPLGAGLVGPAVPIEAVAVVAAIPAVIVAVIPAIHHAMLESAVPPAVTATKPMFPMGQGSQTPLLAVVQRLGERIGGIRDFLHRGR